MGLQDPILNNWNAPSAKLHQYLSLKTTNPLNLLKTTFNSLLLLASNPVLPQHQTLYQAETAFHTLQKWYNTSTGLYSTTGWWNNANILTTLSNLALRSTISPQIELVIAQSFAQAPKWSPQLSDSGSYVKTIHPGTMLIETTWTQSVRENEISDPKEEAAGGFLNEYYDDEGWWALAWIQAYDLTSNAAYLSTAIGIFEDMRNSPRTPCGGGIWWNKSQTYVNAIANELYLSVAAHLANRVGGERKQYLEIALDQWSWFLMSGMINSEGTINDGLKVIREGECRNNNGTVWSYNQGVVLSALVELHRATSDKRHLDTAARIARAAIKKLASGGDGVLHDPCEVRGCGADGVQFKGVFMRGLMSLLDALEDGEELKAFARVNAESIWKRDRNEKGELGVVWSGPVREVNAGSHGSGLDALVAASAVERVQS